MMFTAIGNTRASMPSSTYTEQELIVAIKGNCQKAFGYLYGNYGNTLYGIIIGIVKNEEEACDILQNVFIKIWKNIGQYDMDRGRFYTWMSNIARNAAIDFLRTTYAQDKNKTYSITAHAEQLTPKREAAFDSLTMMQLMNRLETKYKTLIDLSFRKGYTHEEISQLINVPLGTVKTRLRKAIELIRIDYANVAC